MSAAGPPEFAVFECPLDGINLIEASAGTGKTWNICALYLRMLLERRLEVQQILVVTFTNAATAELRERIRARIVEALAFLREGASAGPGDDPFVPALMQTVQARGEVTRESLVLLLDQALQHFDEAAILTIHGFCQRALADAAWSAGLPLALEFVSDDSELVLEAVHDFWRRRVADESCPPLLAAHLHAKKDTPDKYHKIVKRALAKPLAKVLWPAEIETPIAIDTTPLDAAYARACEVWRAERDCVVELLRASQAALYKNQYSLDAIDAAAAVWDVYFQTATPLATFSKVGTPDLLCGARLARATYKNKTTPQHDFFAAADALLSARDAIVADLDLLRLQLLREMLASVPDDVRRRKRERRVIAFDDMLYNLYAALEHGDHPELPGRLRDQYPVALIDEFQDTDPLQFAIFRRIYAGDAAAMFFVGDPKQAIYSFRNADLHAYLRARESVSAAYTLAHNQRSTPGLIGALNALFEQKPDAFVLPGLEYHRAKEGTRRREPFVDTSAKRADLEVWMLPPGPGDKPIPKQDAAIAAVAATAAEISRLITAACSRAITLGKRPLAASDIAVLVRTHAQGTEVKRALAALDVGSVELSQASVFRSVDAEEVERVLIAVANPSRDTLLRGALATEMLGCSATEILRIAGDEASLLGYLEQFAGYRDLWLRRGVGVMYRRLLSEQRVSARMLAHPDGERRLTNLLHLGELIHQAAATHDSPDTLLRWLATQRRDDSQEEAAQLRLESDSNLVRIVTIHRAKGLEFPIVFCPFAWDGILPRNVKEFDARQYHDPEGRAAIDFRLDGELGAERDSIEDAMKLEGAAERVRLHYVALTRAIYRSYLIAGNYVTNGRYPSPKESGRSMLNWLVAGGARSPEQWLPGETRAAEITTAWSEYAKRAAPHAALGPWPTIEGRPLSDTAVQAAALAALPPPKTIAAAWRVASFSGMISDAQAESAANDHDAHVAERATTVGAPPATVAPDDILRFPRGPRAGDCLHAMFERVDFTERSGWDDAIKRALAAHPQPGAAGGAQLAEMSARMLADVTATQLPGGLVLASIAREKRLVELEFDLPLPRLASRELNATLADLGYRVPRLTFRDLAGYLKGFIDLVVEHAGRYYVIDWKSNHLGYAPSDYGAAEVAAAMIEHGYPLQYLLYTLALDRYLRHRIATYRYDTHFGGALYLFIRGVRPDWRNPDGTPSGVHFDRPSATTLARLGALFDVTTAQAAR